MLSLKIMLVFGNRDDGRWPNCPWLGNCEANLYTGDMQMPFVKIPIKKTWIIRAPMVVVLFLYIIFDVKDMWCTLLCKCWRKCIKNNITQKKKQTWRNKYLTTLDFSWIFLREDGARSKIYI